MGLHSNVWMPLTFICYLGYRVVLIVPEWLWQLRQVRFILAKDGLVIQMTDNLKLSTVFKN
jgi:hypothetical protein